jgi:hypothetical protein
MPHPFATDARSQRNRAQKIERQILDALPRASSPADAANLEAAARLAAERWTYCAAHALIALLRAPGPT